MRAMQKQAGQMRCADKQLPPAVMKMRGAMSVPAQKKPPPGRFENRPPTNSNLQIIQNRT